MAKSKNSKEVKRLQRQARFVSDKHDFLKVFRNFLIIVGLGIFISILIGVFDIYYQYYIAGHQADLQERLVNSVNNSKYQELQQTLKPAKLRITNNKVLRNYRDNYDFVSYITNPNEVWYAMVEYHFEGGGYEGESLETFILPKQNRPLWQLNVEHSRPINNSKIVIDNVEWKRASNYVELRQEYLHFSTDDIELKRARDLVGEEYEDVGYLEFTINNNSIYNFWKLGLAIVLKRYDETVAFYYSEIDDFKADSEKTIKLNLFEDIPGVTDIQIIPLLNVFEADNIYID